jgi:hypothetical protein
MARAISRVAVVMVVVTGTTQMLLLLLEVWMPA